MSDYAIEVDHLLVSAGHRKILEVEQFAVGCGEMAAVMGPNGAGKSTFLRTCLGMQRQVQGNVTVLGQPLCQLNALSLSHLRRSIGYLPQLLPVRSELPLTVREVVSMGRAGIAGLLRPLRQADWHLVDEWIERLGLSQLAERPFHEISGGEQRKTVIARAMVQEPRLFLLDEPTANLDLGWRERIVETLEAIYQSARLSVVLVCHELESLPPCCKRVLLLNQGQVLAVGAPEEVFDVERVGRLYGPNLTVSHRNGRHAILPGRSEH